VSGVPSGREQGQPQLGRELAVGAGAGVLIFLVAHVPNLLPVLVLGAVALVMLRAVGGLPGLRPRLLAAPGRRVVPVPSVTFDDIGGQAAAKQELLEALDFLIHADRVRRMGIRPLKGILLTGPPGTGKTLLAKAAANHTGSVFVAASGSEFIEVYAGVGAQRVRELFRRAREEGRAARCPAIVFIDELEVIGGKRGRHQSHLEYDQTLNQLLVEMDGIQPDDGVRILVIGATNRPDLLDDALLRPGRFDRVVRVDLPDREGRRQILELHTRRKPLAPDVDLDRIARATFGFSGAHLESLANEAAILAMREGLDEIPERCFHEAVDKVMLGEKLDRRPTREERYRIAVHEAGHALIGELLEPGSVARVTITSRGQALGYVRQAPREDAYLYSKEKLEAEIQRLLAGSLAEELVFGNRSTGATSDFEQVLRLVRTMVATGMSDLGVVDLESLPDGALHAAGSRIIGALEAQVRDRLQAHRPALLAMAEVLLEEESLTGDRLRELLAAGGVPAVAAAEAAAALAPAGGPDGTGS
jgi:cell division protease FtsH